MSHPVPEVKKKREPKKLALKEKYTLHTSKRSTTDEVIQTEKGKHNLPGHEFPAAWNMWDTDLQIKLRVYLPTPIEVFHSIIQHNSPDTQNKTEEVKMISNKLKMSLSVGHRQTLSCDLTESVLYDPSASLFLELQWWRALWFKDQTALHLSRSQANQSPDYRLTSQVKWWSDGDCVCVIAHSLTCVPSCSCLAACV